MGPSRDQVAPKECNRSLGHIALQSQEAVVLVMREVQELLAQRASGAPLSLGEMKPKEAPEDLEALPRLPHLGTQGVGPGVDVTHLRAPPPLRRQQQLPQAEEQREFVGGALRTLRECRQQRQPL